MSELDVVRRLRERIMTKVPNEARHAIEIEIKRVEDEVSLRSDVLDCTTCPLVESCTNKVPGVGPLDSPIMFIGESPGQNEDAEGVPFVGPAGQMFNAALQAAGFSREHLYVTNILKCHPPGNRQPSQQEIAACFKHLKKEIEVIRPRVIVAMGSLAASTLIHPDFKITQENGHWFELNEGTRGIAIYHPSYLLRLGEGTQRQVNAKWEVFNALKKIREYKEAGFQDTYS